MENKNILAMTEGSVALDDKELKRIEFERVFRDATEVMVEGLGKSRKVITAVAWIPLDILYVDSRYQGLRTHKQLNRLRKHFDKKKLSNIVVVPHYEENRFAIVDGQGRWKLAEEMGFGESGLPATILMDAPDDPMERLRFEAEFFINQNTEVESIKPIEKHYANVINKDEAAMIVDELIKKYEVKLMRNGGVREESVLGSYTETYAIASHQGKECLEFIFSIINNAGWDHETNGYSTAVMRALREAWKNYPLNRESVNTYLSNELRKITPRIFSSKATTVYQNREHKSACMLYIQDMIVEGLHLPKKYYWNENTKKIVNYK